MLFVNLILMFLLSQGGLSKEDVELVVCHLIIEGYIKEDFHFTPYSTIRYRACCITDGTSRKKALIIIPVQALKMVLFLERRVVISPGKKPVFRIRSRIHRIHMFLGLLDPDPDPLVRCMDPDPSIIMQK